MAARSTALHDILTWPRAHRATLLDRVAAACVRAAAAGGPNASTFGATAEVAAQYPGDPGVLATLLLRHVRLPAGAALFIPAGGVHAYIRGVGVEVLANSDNVLRAGLTSKHVDVGELMRIAVPEVDVPILPPVVVDDEVMTYDTPVPEFKVLIVTLDRARKRLAVGGTEDSPLPGGQRLGSERAGRQDGTRPERVRFCRRVRGMRRGRGTRARGGRPLALRGARAVAGFPACCSRIERCERSGRRRRSSRSFVAAAP